MNPRTLKTALDAPAPVFHVPVHELEADVEGDQSSQPRGNMDHSTYGMRVAP